MKRLALLPALLLFAAACEPAVEGTVTMREPDSPFIAFNAWVQAGSQNDPAGKEGLAALTANLIANGSTTQDSYDDILAKLYPMAARYGFQVDKEMTVFGGRVHEDNLEAYYTLLRNAIIEPAWSEADFERVKSQTMNDLQRTRRYGRDEELSKELLFWMAYQGTPYAHPEEGYVQSVQSITLDDVKQFYTDYYVANNIVVGIGGGYPRGFVRRVRDDFDGLPLGEVTQPPAPEPNMPDGAKVLIVEKDVDASAISLGFPTGLVRGHEDFWPMVAVNSWFGEHRESFSHLYQVIRETRGMNYGDYSYIEAYPRGYATQVPPTNVSRRSQLFEIWIRPISLTAPGNLHERTLFATRAAWRELKALVGGGMTDETLGRTQQFLRNYVLNWGQTVSRRLGYAVDDAFYGMEPGYLAAIRPGIEGLTLEQVNTAIQTHLQYDNMWVVFITADAREMRRKLLSGVATPITYAGEKPAELLAEDELIASFPIPVEADDITIIGIEEVFER